jgi:hypothetical protein
LKKSAISAVIVASRRITVRAPQDVQIEKEC